MIEFLLVDEKDIFNSKNKALSSEIKSKIEWFISLENLIEHDRDNDCETDDETLIDHIKGCK